MDKNKKWVREQRVMRTIDNLKKNNMEAYFAEDKEVLLKKLGELLKEGDSVAVGGSATLFETGVIDFLRSGKYNFLDRHKKGLSRENIKEIFRKSFFCNDYLVSTNAVTEDGELYNVDGTGNRVAAMLYGPDHVIVIVGSNKIVKDVNAAVEKVKQDAAPANTKRLGIDTPCSKIGYCVDCKSDSRICNDYVLIKRQNVKGRIKVIILDEDFGY